MVLETPINSFTVIENTTEDVSTRLIKLLVKGLKAIRREIGKTTYRKVSKTENPRAWDVS
jgi:hypothetical protein